MVSFTTLATAGLLATTTLAHPQAHRKFHGKRSTSTSSSSSKRGAAYNDASLVSIMSDSNTISWAYDWSSSKDSSLPDGVEYVPMLWGAKMFDSWSSNIETALSDGSTHILGFNEPDMSSQADMTASEAATYYKEYITPYGDKAVLVTPATSSSETAGEGLDWMTSFLEACTDCNATVMAVHWYGTEASLFESFLEEAIELAGNYSISEVWVTEFGLSSGTVDEAASFIDEVLPWLDSHSAIGRYSYFYCADGYLLDGEALSASGTSFTNATMTVSTSVSASASASVSISAESSSESSSTESSTSSSESSSVEVSSEESFSLDFSESASVDFASRVKEANFSP